jgi:hypothetical protein
VIEPGEELRAHLAVTDPAGAPLPSRLVATTLVDATTGQPELDGSWTTVAAGLGWDFTWTPSEMPPAHGDRRVEITVEVGGRPHRVVAPFRMYYATPVHPTGRVSEHVQEGALLVEAELEAKEGWHCELSANLHDERGRPLEHTTWRGEVGPGRTTMTLAFATDLLQAANFSGGVLFIRQLSGTCRRSSDGASESAALPFEVIPILHVTARAYQPDELVALGAAK